jgi:hypothetical protein
VCHRLLTHRATRRTSALCQDWRARFKRQASQLSCRRGYSANAWPLASLPAMKTLQRLWHAEFEHIRALMPPRPQVVAARIVQAPPVPRRRQLPRSLQIAIFAGSAAGRRGVGGA